MNTLLIMGSGSFSTEVEELARLNGYDNFVYLDDKAESAYCHPVIGSMQSIKELRSDYSNAIVGLGDNESRLKYHSLLKEYNYNIPILVHPTAYVSPDAVLSPGCIIRSAAVISRFVKLGDSCIVNVGAMIDHHCVIEEGCHILMGAVVRNKAVVSRMSWVASNAVVE